MRHTHSMKLLFIFLILKLIKYTIFRNVKVCFSYYIVIQEFPKKNKYVNLGESLLITGGLTKNNVISNKCYLFSYNQNNTFDITSFPEMNVGRINHNLIFIPTRNLLITCGGVSNKTCEIFNFSLIQWYPMTNLQKIRSNACLAYINDKYVYCISGYDNEKRIYNNNCEYLNIEYNNENWVLIDFKFFNFEYMMSAPGVIQINQANVILCGGQDENNNISAKSYLFEFNSEDASLITVSRKQSLPEETLFKHNHFSSYSKCLYNFDIKQTLYEFNIDTGIINKKNLF